MMVSNRHHVLVEQKTGTEFERLEDIGASAIAAARKAQAAAQALDGQTTLALRRELDDLRQIAETRAALTRDARHSLRALIALLQERRDAGPATAIEPLLEALHACLAASETVADLLASERHIGRCRGIA